MSESPNYPSTTIPTEYAIEFLKVAWGVLKQSYGILFLVGVIGLAANLIANLIPFIGTLAYSAASPFLIAGALNVARKAFETGNAEFDDFTKPLNDKDLVSRLIPVSIFSATLTLPSAILTQFSDMGFLAAGAQMILGLVAACLAFCSVPLILFKGAKLQDTFSANINATLSNLVSLFLIGVFYSVLMVLAAIPLGLPILFIALPMGPVIYLLMYLTIFEDHKLEKATEALEAKP